MNSNNVYLFVYPKIFSSKSSIKRNTTTLMNSIGKHLNVISNVYVLFYYRQNITNPPHRITDFATNHTNPEAQPASSNSRGIHALVQEAFSIRNTTIIHALEPTVKKVMAKVTNNASTTGETESIEIVPLTSHVFHYFQQRRKDWMGATVIGAGLVSKRNILFYSEPTHFSEKSITILYGIVKNAFFVPCILVPKYFLRD